MLKRGLRAVEIHLLGPGLSVTVSMSLLLEGCLQCNGLVENISWASYTFFYFCTALTTLCDRHSDFGRNDWYMWPWSSRDVVCECDCETGGLED